MGELTPAPRGYPIKLVRDRTAEIINSTGVPGDLFYGPADLVTVERFLRLKLAEEVGEYLVDGGTSELADIFAVVAALGVLAGVDLAAMAAADVRGGFFDGVMMYGRHEEFDR